MYGCPIQLNNLSKKRWIPVLGLDINFLNMANHLERIQMEFNFILLDVLLELFENVWCLIFFLCLRLIKFQPSLA
jgi:hypothetical protein